MKEPKTKVIFRKFPKSEGGEVIALFPAIAGKAGDPYTCSSYIHIGQHASASVDLVRSTRLAKMEEYKDLARELINLGYTLRIVSRFTRADLAARKEQLG